MGSCQELFHRYISVVNMILSEGKKGCAQKCPYCGSLSEGGFAFCHRCGKRIG